MSIGADCLGNVIEYLDTRDWIQFSYTCKTVNDFKRAKHLMLQKKRTLVREDTVEAAAALTLCPESLFNVDLLANESSDSEFLKPLTGTVHNLRLSLCQEPDANNHTFRHLHSVHTLRLRAHSALFVPRPEDFAHLTNIHSLDISYGRAITNAMLAYLPALRELNMAYFDGPTVDDTVFKHLPNLHTLNITRCAQFTDAAFEHLGKLTSLTAGGCHDLTDAALAHTPLLRELRINGCANLTEQGIAHLTELRILIMPYCFNIKASAFDKLTELHTLDVSGCSLPGAATLRKLRNLCANRCGGLTDSTFEHLGNLRALSMNNCQNVTPGAFRHPSKLRSLSMKHCPEMDLGPDNFRNLTELRALDISGSGRFSHRVLKPLGKLVVLDISARDGYLDRDVLDSLHNLRALAIEGCTWVSDRHFAYFGNLEVLDMSRCSQRAISDKGFAHLGSVHTLDMSWCTQETITDAAFKSLKSIRTLTVPHYGAFGSVESARKTVGNPTCTIIGSGVRVFRKSWFNRWAEHYLQ
jgi:Leucine-rich repeat (LRR) protein